MLKRRLDEVLARKKKSRYWLAKQTGISQQNLGRIARGETTAIDFDILENICEKLDCQPGDLLVYIKDNKAANNSRSP